MNRSPWNMVMIYMIFTLSIPPASPVYIMMYYCIYVLTYADVSCCWTRIILISIFTHKVRSVIRQRNNVKIEGSFTKAQSGVTFTLPWYSITSHVQISRLAPFLCALWVAHYMLNDVVHNLGAFRTRYSVCVWPLYVYWKIRMLHQCCNPLSGQPADRNLDSD